MRLWVCPQWSKILLSSMIAKTFAPENGVKSFAIMKSRSGVRIAGADMGNRECGIGRLARRDRGPAVWTGQRIGVLSQDAS